MIVNYGAITITTDNEEDKKLCGTIEVLRNIQKEMGERKCSTIFDPMYGQTWESKYIEDVIEFLQSITQTFEIE